MTRQAYLLAGRTVGCFCLGLLCSAAAVGQQNDRTSQQSDSNKQQQGDQAISPAELPQFLTDLDLDSGQKTKIKQTLNEHNQKLKQTWSDFNKKHIRTIELEAAWASAVRDSLSEEDQRKFDQQRMQEREMARHSEANNSQQHQSADSRQSDSGNAREQDKAKSESDSTEHRQTNRQDREQERADRQQARRDKKSSRDQGQQDADEDQAYGFVVITTISPERYAQGTNQDSQQMQQCSEACREYKQELTSAWQDLHRLHHELVQIEADRIQAVEKQLTEEQLTKLRKNRQQPQAATASATSASQQSR